MQDQANTASDHLNNFFSKIVNALPTILGALVILLIGYVVARLLESVTRKALEAARLNYHLRAGQGGNLIQRAVPDPTDLIAKIVFWAIFLFGISVSVSALGIPALVDMVNGVYAYLPNVLAAFLIFLVAGAVSAAVATMISNTMGDTPTGKVAATAAPIVVMGIATFMILNQLRIAPEIVTITYAGLVGTATLAFGLGGKDAASRLFMDLYESGQKNKGQISRDLKKGSSNTKAKAKDLKRKA